MTSVLQLTLCDDTKIINTNTIEGHTDKYGCIDYKFENGSCQKRFPFEFVQNNTFMQGNVLLKLSVFQCNVQQ